MNVNKLVAVAAANELLIGGSIDTLFLMMDEADTVFAVFNEPDGGVGAMLIKGSDGDPLAVVKTAFSFGDREQATEAKQLYAGHARALAKAELTRHSVAYGEATERAQVQALEGFLGFEGGWELTSSRLIWLNLMLEAVQKREVLSALQRHQNRHLLDRMVEEVSALRDAGTRAVESHLEGQVALAPSSGPAKYWLSVCADSAAHLIATLSLAVKEEDSPYFDALGRSLALADSIAEAESLPPGAIQSAAVSALQDMRTSLDAQLQ